MDIDSDGLTDLILISSPMYKDVDREGRVYVCELSRLVNAEYFTFILSNQSFSHVKFCTAKRWQNTTKIFSFPHFSRVSFVILIIHHK